MSNHPLAGVLLVSDLDGTLLDSRKQISPENRRALERFVAGGGRFTLATGRMEGSVEPYLPLLPINAPAILYNGAAIYDFLQRKMIWERFLEPDVPALLTEIIAEFPGIAVEVYRGGAIYFVRRNAVTERLERGLETETGMDQLPLPWRKVLTAWEPEQLDRVEAFLKTKTLPCDLVRSDPCYLELLPRGASKGVALRILAGLLGLSLANTVAIGDHLNDLDLIREAGIGVSVANGHPDLKAVADRISLHHEEHALAEVVAWLEEQRTPPARSGPRWLKGTYRQENYSNK